MPLTHHVRNDDETYGPTESNRFYISKADHRTHSNNQKKTKWCIQEGQEFEVFRLAEDVCFDEDFRWYCNENLCVFSIINKGKTPLGTKDEKLAKFIEPENPQDPWHGYPVTSSKPWNRPGEVLLDRLEQVKIISRSTKLKIEKGRL